MTATIAALQTAVYSTGDTIQRVVEENNDIETRATVGGLVGGAIGYTTAAGVVAGAMCGAGALAAVPVSYTIVETLEPTASKSKKIFHTAALSGGVGVLTPYLFSYVAGIVTGTIVAVVVISGVVAYKCPGTRAFFASIPDLLRNLLPK